MLAQFFAQFGPREDSGLEGYKCDNALAFDFIGPAHHGGLRDGGMRHQGALDLAGAEAVPGHVEHVVDAPDDPEIAILVPPGAVAGKVTPRDVAPVLFLVAAIVAIDGTEHRRPRLANDQLALPG